MDYLTHFYTAKRARFWQDPNPVPRVKLLCTGQWTNSHTVKAGTMPHNVTCGGCLKLLIPKQRAILERMEAAHAHASQSTGTVDRSETPGYSETTHGAE